MKTVVLSFFLSFSMLMGFAQEKTKQQIKEEQKQIRMQKMEELLNSKQFEFVGNMAYPQSGRSIDLTTNTNYFRVKNDSIHSEMPYFGRAFAGVGYGSDSGLSFKGPMSNYIIKKNKKNFVVKTNVKGSSDSYSIVLTVFSDGGATLSISSNNRNTISYRGELDKLPVPVK